MDKSGIEHSIKESAAYMAADSYIKVELKGEIHSMRHKKRHWIYKRGDIYMANLNPYKGSEQGGKRPVIVLQNNKGNRYGPTLIVAPITSKLYKTELPTHYILKEVRGLPDESLVLLEQIKTIDKKRVMNYVGKVSEEQMEEIDKQILVSLGI